MSTLPPLDLDAFPPTRDALHAHAKVLGAVRRALTPKQRHWWHISLHLSAIGLTTTPIPLPGGSFDVTLDLIETASVLRTSDGERRKIPLDDCSPAEHSRLLRQAVARLGGTMELDAEAFAADSLPLDAELARTYFMVLARLDLMLKRFAGSLREATSPVQLFPHHFDLAVSWFSGRLVPTEDPDDEEAADEQLTFGFSPGDSLIGSPYLYATAYPRPRGWGEFELPSPGRWQTDGFHGAVLDYDDLVNRAEPETVILQFLRAVQRHGADLMAH